MRENVERIEREIDAEGLVALFEVIVLVCHEKAAHIRENWQDESLAKDWERAGKQVDRWLASKVGNALYKVS